MERSSYRRIIAEKFSTNFRETRIETVSIPRPLPGDHVVVAVEYAAINASDINYIAGRYDPNAKPPLYPGLIIIICLDPSIDATLKDSKRLEP